MYVEQWSHEEIEQFRGNQNLLFSKTNELRSKVILELLARMTRRMTAILQHQGRKTTASNKDKLSIKGV